MLRKLHLATTTNFSAHNILVLKNTMPCKHIVHSVRNGHIDHRRLDRIEPMHRGKTWSICSAGHTLIRCAERSESPVRCEHNNLHQRAPGRTCQLVSKILHESALRLACHAKPIKRAEVVVRKACRCFSCLLSRQHLISEHALRKKAALRRVHRLLHQVQACSHLIPILQPAKSKLVQRFTKMRERVYLRPYTNTGNF